MKSIKINFLIKISILIFWLIILFFYLLLPILKNSIENNTINILTWGDMITLNTVENFEKQTGIKVNLNYYETNEELFAKLQVTKGSEYDLITITDFGLAFMREQDLVKKIDKNKLDFWNKIDPHFLNLNFDKNYDYSIPFVWDIFGLGINKKLLKNNYDNSWALIFDPKYMQNKICMTDDAFNAISIARQYLFNDLVNLNKDQIDQIKKVLVQQRKWVELYTDLRTDYVLKAGICPVVATESAFIFKILRNDNNLAFIIPKEGGFLIINLLVIPKSSTKENLVYKFINYLFQEKNILEHFEEYGYLPIFKDLLIKIDLKPLNGLENIFAKFDKLGSFKNNLTLDQVNNIWVATKA